MSAYHDPPTPRITRLGDLLEELEADAAAAHEARNTPGMLRGPITGLTDLDRKLGGWLEPGLHICHGNPGSGKTALALQIAGSCGFPCLFVSLEMRVLELLRRTIARVTEVYLGRLKSGELTPSEVVRHARLTAQVCPELVLADATNLGAAVAAGEHDPTRRFDPYKWVQDAALVAKGDAPHLLIVVDSIHSWTDAVALPGMAEYESLNLALSHLRVIGTQLNCPIVGVAERNRASMAKGGQSAGAGTRKLEYGAHSVWDLHRDADAQPDSSGEVDIKLTLAKNRNGAQGIFVKLKFHGAKQAFREVSF